MKFNKCAGHAFTDPVALRGRAWIEIVNLHKYPRPKTCRPPREGVD